MTKRISSVAYAVEEIASDEKTASAIVLRDPLVLLLGGGERPPDQDPLDDGHVPRFVRSVADGTLTDRQPEARQSGTPRARDSASAPVRAIGFPAMRVAIAGAGNVGLHVADVARSRPATRS